MKFVKMHGLGNDFIIVEDFEEKLKLTVSDIKKLCHRNFGIGADGLVLIQPSDQADWRMRIFNYDGMEAEMCGNALRCVARYLYQRGLSKELEVTLETLKGVNRARIFLKGDDVESVEINMGEPILDSSLIPAGGENRLILMEDIILEGGLSFKITAVSMGNPHCVIFVNDCKKMRLEEIGPQIEHHTFFPQRTNVEFVEFLNEKEIKMRVWERGVGETLSCGSGACASVVASVLNNLTERKVTVNLPGGKLEIYWNEKNNNIFMKGPAVEVFSGETSG